MCRSVGHEHGTVVDGMPMPMPMPIPTMTAIVLREVNKRHILRAWVASATVSRLCWVLTTLLRWPLISHAAGQEYILCIAVVAAVV